MAVLEGFVDGLGGRVLATSPDPSPSPSPSAAAALVEADGDTGVEETCTLVREAIQMVENAETEAQVELLLGGMLNVWTAEAGQVFDESTCAGEACAGTFGIKGIRVQGGDGTTFSVTCNAAECADDPDNTWCPVKFEGSADHGRRINHGGHNFHLPPPLDKCHPSNSRLLLADGTLKPIGEV